jgi:hypothetical protein
MYALLSHVQAVPTISMCQSLHCRVHFRVALKLVRRRVYDCGQVRHSICAYLSSVQNGPGCSQLLIRAVR